MNLYVLIFLFIIGWVLITKPVLRFTLKQPLKSFKYGVKDFYWWLKHQDWQKPKTGVIDCYVGLFGKGKTLSAVHKVCSMYKLYNDKTVWCRDRKKFVKQKVQILSNVELKNIPYQKLISMQQIIYVAENQRKTDYNNNTKTITLVLGDEFSSQMNSRNFKSNLDPLLLNTILTCRHHDISLFYTSQRFGFVDALLRQVTTNVISCQKTWRCQMQYFYDAYDMEKAGNPQLVNYKSQSGFFVEDTHYNAYDTIACVDNLVDGYKKGDMLTPDQILQLQCNTGYNMDVVNPSKKWLKTRKNTKKRNA